MMLPVILNMCLFLQQTSEIGYLTSSRDQVSTDHSFGFARSPSSRRASDRRVRRTAGTPQRARSERNAEIGIPAKPSSFIAPLYAKPARGGAQRRGWASG